MNKTNAVDVSIQAVSPLFMFANAGKEKRLKITKIKKVLTRFKKLEKKFISTPLLDRGNIC